MPADPPPTGSPSAARRRVLFVDDDPAFLEVVTGLMTELSRGSWEILTARNASEAFQMLQQRPVDLVVLDVEMQAIDGVQVLSLLNRSHPHLQKAVLTGYATENYRAACLAQGAELFLEKPTTPDGWASVHAALQQLMEFPPERGFRGVLRRVGLTEILQMECLGRSSSLLEVTAGSLTGRIFVEDGQIVHAELGEYTGEAAFQRILALPGGQFVVHPLREPPARTIQNSWEFLLMEAARVQDELRAEMAGTSPAGEGAPVGAAGPAVAEEPTGPDRVADPGVPAPPAGAFPEPEPSSQAIEAPAAPAVPGASVAAPAGQAPPLDTTLPEATALVICDDHGELLYDWNCPDRAAWVNILEFVTQKARRLAPADEFGEFDRMEVFEESGRRLIVLRPGFAMALAFGEESPARPARTPGPARLREDPAAWGNGCGASRCNRAWSCGPFDLPTAAWFPTWTHGIFPPPGWTMQAGPCWTRTRCCRRTGCGHSGCDGGTNR
ncbi:MAG: hypothetical protein KatS3mg132_651 [Limisphaera sp.]|nr:MAG: hypothetical protein KatS3mg132_651 [Limisphaera sp.]